MAQQAGRGSAQAAPRGDAAGQPGIPRRYARPALSVTAAWPRVSRPRRTGYNARMKALLVAILVAGCSSSDACDRAGTRLAAAAAAGMGATPAGKEAASSLADRVGPAIADT